MTATTRTRRTAQPTDTRPGHGMPCDWISLGSRYSTETAVSSERHRRVGATDQDLGLRVRCHDCGAMARQKWQRIYESPIHGVVAVGRDPLTKALERLDRTPCQPLGQADLFTTTGGAA